MGPARLTSSLMHVLVRWLQGQYRPSRRFQGLGLIKAEIDLFESQCKVSSFGIRSPGVFVDVLSTAAASSDESSAHVLAPTLEAILWLGLLDADFWSSLISNDVFCTTLKSFLLGDEKSLRLMVVKKAREFIVREDSMVSDASLPRVARFFWSLTSQLIREAADCPEYCHEVFDLSFFLLRDAYSNWRKDVDFPALATLFGSLLLNHDSIEVCAAPSRCPLA